MSEIAVSGRSNVGKSSLLNKLLSKKNIARVSKEPGKTRTINFFLLNDRFYLVDLPGYGYAKVSKEMRTGWQKVIFEYIEKRETLAGVIQLIDAEAPVDEGRSCHDREAHRRRKKVPRRLHEIGQDKRK